MSRVRLTPLDFVRESNRIEGIIREPNHEEMAEYHRFMALKEISIDDMELFVKVYQPDAMLRSRTGLNVQIGNHLPPPGGPKIIVKLELLLKVANADRGFPEGAFAVHHDYESLHPFTDGNGRSGRMLWMWMMQVAPLGFLHHWYYQSLSEGR